VSFFFHENATKEQYLAKIYDHPMVVLYTHADPGIGGEEGNLYFHDDKSSVSDLMLVDPLPTELLILSVCNMGIGKIRPGEGVFSLARGFAAAGIPTSVTTLWEIDSRATYTLTQTFYENVVAGLPLDVALQKAKLSMLHGTDPMHALPYFWGGNIVLGNVQPLEFESRWSTTHRFWLAGLLALVFYLLVGYRRKKQMG
jgi:CHAT domain-containing protein